MTYWHYLIPPPPQVPSTGMSITPSSTPPNPYSRCGKMGAVLVRLQSMIRIPYPWNAPYQHEIWSWDNCWTHSTSPCTWHPIDWITWRTSYRGYPTTISVLSCKKFTFYCGIPPMALSIKRSITPQRNSSVCQIILWHALTKSHIWSFWPQLSRATTMLQ